MKILTKEDILNHKDYHSSLDMCRNVGKNMKGYMCHEFVHILYVLKEIMGESCKTYLEIGTHNGGSLATVMQSKYKTDFYGVDVWGRIENMRFTTTNVDNHNIHKHKYELIRGLSSDDKILEIVKQKCPVIDMLFIDGGHEYDTVINDFEKFAPLVSKNGIIIFDDYLMFERPAPVRFNAVEKARKGQVRTAVDDIIGKYKSEYNIIGVIPNNSRANSGGVWDYNIDYIIQKV